MTKSKNIIKLHRNSSTGVASLTLPADIKGDIPPGSLFQPAIECIDNRLRIVYEMMIISPAAVSAKTSEQQDQPNTTPNEMVQHG